MWALEKWEDGSEVSQPHLNPTLSSVNWEN